MTTPHSPAEQDRVPVHPGSLRAFAAMFRDTWREFLDAKVLYLVLLAIGLLFATAVSGRIQPLAGGRAYVDLAARAMAADLVGFDLATQPVTDMAGRLEGAVWAASAAEPLGPDLPATPWKVTLSRTFVPLAVKPAATPSGAGETIRGRSWTRARADVSREHQRSDPNPPPGQSRIVGDVFADSRREAPCC